jgi:uroporphyrinogen decarboxylase
MIPREVIRTVLEGGKPPYVPWSFGFTKEAAAKLVQHYGTEDLQPIFRNHFMGLGNGVGFFSPLENERYRDVFGVVWNREVDKDIGIVEGTVLPEPSLKGYEFPDPEADRFFVNIPARIESNPDKFRVFNIGFSLYERAWTLRGMENLLMDFYQEPDFVHELFEAIGEYNVTQARKALQYDIDAVYFGDDWGQQHGLIMGPQLWREFIKPILAKMYGAVKDEGKFVIIHSCGDVDELFDDLIDLGLDCFNPFQPEVMDTEALLRRYRGKLAFHGGLSTQKVLPFCTADEVRAETLRLLELGRDGGYIFSPAHAVEGDVPTENMVAFIETVQAQEGYAG